MLLGSREEVIEQIGRYLEVGVSHFILILTPFNFDVMPRFAQEVMPEFRGTAAIIVPSAEDHPTPG